MNAQEFVTALEPFIAELESIAKRVGDIEGRNPINDIAKALADDTAFCESLRLKPEDFELPVDDNIAELVKQYGDDLRGEAPTAEAVAVELVEKFSAALRGLTGEPGKDGQPGKDGEPGADGKDADPDQVAEALKSDAAFLDAIKGNDGAPGADGAAGQDAPALDPSDVAAVLKLDDAFTDSLRGEPGVPGQPGEPGADGAGILAPQHVPGQVYRADSLVTAYLGQYYRAKVDTVAMPGDSDDWERVGLAGMRWRGLKPDEATLKHGDIYIDGGSLFGFFGEKASMLVQRPKPAPSITKFSLNDGTLQIVLTNGAEFAVRLPEPVNVIKNVENLTRRIMQLESALDQANETIKQLLEAVAELDRRSE